MKLKIPSKQNFVNHVIHIHDKCANIPSKNHWEAFPLFRNSLLVKCLHLSHLNKQGNEKCNTISSSRWDSTLVHQKLSSICIHKYLPVLFMCLKISHGSSCVCEFSLRNKKKCLNLIFVPQQCLYNALIMVFIVSSL